MKRMMTIVLAVLISTALNAQNQEWSYPEGKEKMQEFFEQNIQYPESAKKDKIEGIVYVYTTIDKNGKAKDIKVGKTSSYPDLDKEAERVVKLVKKWNPRYRNGKPVDVNAIIPVEFKLPGSSKRFEGLHNESIYPEGEEVWNAFVKKNFVYPESLKGRNISGTLFVNMDIDKEGKPGNYAISNPSSYPELDAEAIRVAKLVERWEPTKDINGNPYATRHLVRVDFQAPEAVEAAPVVKAATQEPLVIASNPSYPGGYNAMTIFISRNTQYPAEELEKKIEGDVEVEFTVGEDGSLTDLQVVKSVSKGLDAEALRIVGLMPKWNPARTTDGRVTPCQMTIPVNFRVPRAIDGVPLH